ncbi:MAG: PAS domain S-box protein [Bacteroidetes bacterium]|nr:PAS domain S-box protein [Bacteroidota bacterium]
MLDGVRVEQQEAAGLSQISANIVIFFGAAITVSWMMGLPLLWSESWPARLTRPNAGLCFFIGGLALRLIQENRINGAWKLPELGFTFTVLRTAQILGGILSIIGLVTIIEYLSAVNFRISTLIVFQRWFMEIDDGSARMSIVTALQVFLAGFIFIFPDKSTMKNVYPSEILAAIVMTISLDSFIAFLYMSDRIADIRSETPIPVISSIMFFVLAVGFLASRQNRGIVAVWLARFNGSTIVRKWLPVGIITIILAGEVVDILQDYNVLHPGISLSIFTVVVISFIGIVVLFSAVHLNDFEKELLQTNKLYAVLSQSNETMVRTKDRRLLLNSICDTMIIFGDFAASYIFLKGEGLDLPEIHACSGKGCSRFREDTETMRGFLESAPIRQVFEGKEYAVFNDTNSGGLPSSMSDLMDRVGHRSMMVLRLTIFGEGAGLMGVCSQESNYFKKQEIDLIREVAMDLSFALEGRERELQRQRAEEALRQSEERFRATFEKAAVGIVLLTPTGIIMRANPRFCYITGYDESELTGSSFQEITHAEDAGKDRSNLEKMLKGEIATYSTEKRYMRKDGRHVWVNLSAALVRGTDGEPLNIISIVQDISERKEAEELLRKSREQYLQFFEEDITADFIATVEGKITSCNPAFVRIFGFSSVEEAMLSDASELYQSPEQRREFLQLLENVRKIEYHEMTMRKKGGSEIYVIRSAFGIFDERGRLLQTKNHLFDDTRRRNLERQILQAQKMESLGTLAGGIAHDFNNILTIIMGHAGLLKRRELTDDRAKRSLDAIDLATRRGSGLIRQLLTFARKEDRALESVDINEIVRDLHKLLGETFPRLVTIRLELDDTLPLIVGDPNQIHQALLNLCVNARDAMLERKDGKPPGGILSLSTSHVEGTDIRTAYPKAVREKYVSIIVADTGAGMSEATRSHIFEPFFTTKDRGKGTGLGLATVYGIVEGHEGFMDVSSEPGVGTSFAVYLPAQPQEQTREAHDESAVSEIAGGSETILVVEDEEMLMDFLKEILTRKGYRVLTAPDGETAISVFAANFKNIDLVLSDLGLPRLGGQDMLGQLLKINPDVRVIFASGFMDPETKFAIAGIGAHEFIQKPYSAVEVLSRVKEVLNK